MRHTISALVENKSGVLAKISGLFSARAYNIDSLSVGKKNSFIQKEKKSESLLVSDLLLGEGLASTLQIDDQTLWIKCNIQNSGEYLLSLSFSSSFSSYSTTVSLRRGQPLNLGQVTRNLRNSDRSLSINKGVSVKNRINKRQINYLLKIK